MRENGVGFRVITNSGLVQRLQGEEVGGWQEERAGRQQRVVGWQLGLWREGKL